MCHQRSILIKNRTLYPFQYLRYDFHLLNIAAGNPFEMGSGIGKIEKGGWTNALDRERNGQTLVDANGRKLKQDNCFVRSCGIDKTKGTGGLTNASDRERSGQTLVDANGRKLKQDNRFVRSCGIDKTKGTGGLTNASDRERNGRTLVHANSSRW